MSADETPTPDTLRKLATRARMGELLDPAAVIVFAADRIEQLEAENEALRETLKRVVES